MKEMFRTSLAFARSSDDELNGFAQNVIDSLTGNAGFPAPLIPLADLTTALTAFREALATAFERRTGGDRAAERRARCTGHVAAAGSRLRAGRGG
jgi:hypothetical protein